MGQPAAVAATSPPYPQVPVLEQNLAIATLIVNVLVPGLGTLIAGIVGERPLIGRAVAQFLLAIIIVGWVWAVVTGIQLLQNAVWGQRRGAPARA